MPGNADFSRLIDKKVDRGPLISIVRLHDGVECANEE